VFYRIDAAAQQRVVMITISDVGEGLLRVNVIPRKLEGSSDEDGALTRTALGLRAKPRNSTVNCRSQLAFVHRIGQSDRVRTSTKLRTKHAAAIKRFRS